MSNLGVTEHTMRYREIIFYYWTRTRTLYRPLRIIFELDCVINILVRCSRTESDNVQKYAHLHDALSRIIFIVECEMQNELHRRM